MLAHMERSPPAHDWVMKSTNLISQGEERHMVAKELQKLKNAHGQCSDSFTCKEVSLGPLGGDYWV
jgi:hypothetical protein